MVNSALQIAKGANTKGPLKIQIDSGQHEHFFLSSPLPKALTSFTDVVSGCAVSTVGPVVYNKT